MNFAYLIKSQRGASTILTPCNAVENTPLLRARTLIALKWKHKQLYVRETSNPAWKEYTDNANLPKMDLNLESIQPGVVAIVPYIPYAPAHAQPGRYLLNVSSYENPTLFESVYLRSSLAYLDKHPQMLEQFPEMQKLESA